MATSETIQRFFEQDHDKLDERLRTFHVLKWSDSNKAKQVFDEFDRGLRDHIAWEEDLLFPLWHEKAPQTDGLAMSLIQDEHRKIFEHMNAFRDKVTKKSLDTDGEEQILLRLLRSHHMEEERLLYSTIDKVTTLEERHVLFRNIELKKKVSIIDHNHNG